MHVALEHPQLVGAVAWCETGQRGMGGPPWERPLRYLADSPVYFLDRVTTPLLLVTGSQDSAVSRAQSGEVFVGCGGWGGPARCWSAAGKGTAGRGGRRRTGARR